MILDCEIKRSGRKYRLIAILILLRLFVHIPPLQQDHKCIDDNTIAGPALLCSCKLACSGVTRSDPHVVEMRRHTDIPTSDISSIMHSKYERTTMYTTAILLSKGVHTTAAIPDRYVAVLRT